MFDTLKWWIAVGLTGATALTFLGSMLVFFRGQRGDWSFRLVLFASILAALFAIFVPLSDRNAIGGTAFAIALTLLITAQALFWSAVRAHGKNRPSGAFALDPPTTVTVRGPYRFVRHPFYLAYVLGFAAGAVLTEALWALTVPVWMSFVYAVAARQEEELILGSSLATAYREYMERVGGLLPRLRISQDSRPSEEI